MILSTATPESPLLFQCVFIFGRRRSPTANLTVLPAGRCQKQIWAPLAAGWNNACTWVQRRKHDKKQTSVQTKDWCQTPSLSNSQTSWKAILQLWLYQGSDHTHRNSTNSLWLLHSWMNFHSVHELHWKERHRAVPGWTALGTCLQEAKVPPYFQSQQQHKQD